MTFWILALAMTAAAALLIVLALMCAGREQGAAAADMQVYKDQLAEVDRDLARGVISESDAETVRIEVSRRLLEADRQAAAGRRDGAAPKAATAALAVAVAAVLVGGALGLYRWIGAPGYPDLPLAKRIAAAEDARRSRPDQATAEAEAAALPRLPVEASEEYSDLMERLRSAVAERPSDLQGQRLLARNEAALGNFAAAAKAQARVLEILGGASTADDHAVQADFLIMAAGGYVSPEAEAALARALESDPENGAARYYSGLLFLQTGRPDLAFGLWSALLESSAAGDPWVPPIRAQIEDLARVAGVANYQPPVPAAPAPERGPTAEDLEAAAAMTAEERMEMIRGMVAGLSERLATEGGPPEDWARLIGALGVLGESERASAIADEAAEVFAGNDAALGLIADARERAGLK